MRAACLAFKYASHMNAYISPFAFLASDLRAFVLAERVFAALFTLVIAHAMFA